MIKLDDKLYTSTEVASILGVSLRSVYRYLEEGKLIAEVKTATNRHRFTRQDILNFLYPKGDVKTESEQVVTAPKVVEPEPIKAEVPTPENDEEDVDWLSKFRAAAEKFKQEDEKETVPSSDLSTAEPLSAPIVSDITVEKDEEPSNLFYYRSSLGGLKDIAQNLDKSAKEASLDYAFTLNAGLSLHKPIKPFSLLHAYIKPSDLSYFEKLLSLSPSDSANAQLCFITTDKGTIFSTKELLHGLSVVARQQLHQDVVEMAPELKSEVADLL